MSDEKKLSDREKWLVDVHKLKDLIAKERAELQKHADALTKLKGGLALVKGKMNAGEAYPQ